MTIDELVEEYSELGREVFRLESNGQADTYNLITFIVEDQGRALILDVGWEANVGVHASVRAVVNGAYSNPEVFALDDAVMIAAR